MTYRDQQLWICGKPWDIRFLQHEIVSDGEVCHGDTKPSRLLIQVSTLHAHEVIKSTLVHEISHAIISTTTNTHQADEEACVQSSEAGWYSILTDKRNKWFRKLLCDDG